MASDGDAAGRRRAAAHVVVDDLSAPDGELALDPDAAHHLSAVLRLRAGQPVGATDGRGGYRRCRFAAGGRLAVESDVVRTPRPDPLLTVGFVPVKGERPEWAVQKLTELGVDRIVVARSARAVVRWDGDRRGGHLERLRRVARSAVMQSRQVWLPEVDAADSVASFAGRPGSFLAEPGGGAAWGPMVDTVLVGPEGGWTEEEVAPFAAAGRLIGLGPSVLRAETAVVAAGTLLTALRAGLVGGAAR